MICIEAPISLSKATAVAYTGHMRELIVLEPVRFIGQSVFSYFDFSSNVGSLRKGSNGKELIFAKVYKSE